MPLGRRLDAVGHLDRRRPSCALAPRRPDADVRIALGRATEPGRHEPSARFNDRGRMARRKRRGLEDELGCHDGGLCAWQCRRREGDRQRDGQGERCAATTERAHRSHESDLYGREDRPDARGRADQTNPGLGVSTAIAGRAGRSSAPSLLEHLGVDRLHGVDVSLPRQRLGEGTGRLCHRGAIGVQHSRQRPSDGGDVVRVCDDEARIGPASAESQSPRGTRPPWSRGISPRPRRGPPRPGPAARAGRGVGGAAPRGPRDRNLTPA
jgi:hypothetical protein